MSIATDDERFSLDLAARFQLRYEYLYSDLRANHSIVTLRRIQPDIQGHAYDPNLRFRLMFDISQGASLRDGWVSYRVSDALLIRAGQFNIPFSWERHAPPTRHQFAERSAANNEFQWPTGRDLGVMLHGDPTDKFRYAVGVFGGQGRNVAPEGTTGHMASTRLIFTPVGSYQTSEVPIDRAENFHLSLAFGAYGTVNNTAHDWQPGLDEDPDPIDYVVGTTADVHIRAARVSLHLASFYRILATPERTIVVDDISVTSGGLRRGHGMTAHLGYLLIPERLVGVFRYSESRPDADLAVGHLRQAILGTQILHLGHNSKLHAEAGLQWQRVSENNWQAESLIRLQYQFLF